MRLTKNQIKELVAKRVIYNLEDESTDYKTSLIDEVTSYIDSRFEKVLDFSKTEMVENELTDILVIEDTFFNRKMKNLVASAFIDDIRLNYYYQNGYNNAERRYNELYAQNKLKGMERVKMGYMLKTETKEYSPTHWQFRYILRVCTLNKLGIAQTLEIPKELVLEWEEDKKKLSDDEIVKKTEVKYIDNINKNFGKLLDVDVRHLTRKLRLAETENVVQKKKTNQHDETNRR
ncbi:hypothetical protein NFD60_13275 (plasmid) [Staphylococcus epidermidis]|nr:hypothetical protein NFD60_13275 [Staphylococcus epidermidis]